MGPLATSQAPRQQLLLLLMALCATSCSAWTTGQTQRRAGAWSMYIEAPADYDLRRRRGTHTISPAPERRRPPLLDILPQGVKSKGKAVAQPKMHGMPWKSSISPKNDIELTYMGFWRWQMQYMEENLTNLRALPCESKSGNDMSYVEDDKGSMRMHTCCFTSDEYELIRMTTLDGGDRTQVFTSLWYPRGDAPVLGVDLLKFGAHKHLCIVDFQPISDTHAPFEHLLAPVRRQAPSLQGTMTDRFYGPDDSYFSTQMLLGRHNGGGSDETKDSAEYMVQRDLFPAYQKYVQTHVQLAAEAAAVAATTTTAAAAIEQNHAAYDTYSAARDPAHALLARAFGPDWADDYVYDILFPQAARPQTNSAKS